MSEIQRIASDLAHVKRRIAEMEAGTRGVTGSEAFAIQLRNLHKTRERLELEYVLGKLDHGWSAAEIIRRMELPVPQ
jgi:hypothetical protein